MGGVRFGQGRIRARLLAASVVAFALAGSGAAAAISASAAAVTSIRDVSAADLVRALCSAPTESLVRYADLDADEMEEAIVSVVCGNAELSTTAIFIAGPTGPVEIGTLIGYGVTVDAGSPKTLTLFAPPLSDNAGVTESVYALAGGELELLEQRLLTFHDYLSAALTGGASANTDYVFNPHVQGIVRLLPRPYAVHLPSGYQPRTPAPLLISLHGFTSPGGDVHETKFFRFRKEADARGWIYVHPNGIKDSADNRFWNATDACCDMFFTGVDDVAFIAKLINDVSSQYSVDAERIYVVGHSNGGFMAHRLACDLSDRITAIVSIGGAQRLDRTQCAPTSSVAVLEIHGLSDEFVHYPGGALSPPPSGDDYPLSVYPRFPSARETIAQWASLNGCGPVISRLALRFDLDLSLPGKETRVERYSSCEHGAVELWTMEGGTHVPALNYRRWPGPVFDFLANAQP
jgi:polyhydroxybutyrate depolymerase